MAELRFLRAKQKASSARSLLKLLAADVDARIGEQVVDQARHPLGAVNGIHDVFVGFFVQLTPIRSLSSCR